MDQLRIRFGPYSQVWEPSTQTNSMNMRRRGAIALGPLTTSTTSYLFLSLDTGKIINRAQFTEIPMTASVIDRVDQLGSGEPAMLTWTNCSGEIIGDGPFRDTMATSSDASVTSNVARATEEDEDDDAVSVAEENWELPTTDVDVVDNIAGVDNTQEVYEVWNEDVPDVQDVDDQINDDVEVVTKSASGGVTTAKWDQPLKVIPEVTDATNVSPTDTG